MLEASKLLKKEYPDHGDISTKSNGMTEFRLKKIPSKYDVLEKEKEKEKEKEEKDQNKKVSKKQSKKTQKKKSVKNKTQKKFSLF